MKKLRMHAARSLPYESQTNWTLCSRHVGPNQIALFENWVTCRRCLDVIEFHRKCEAERQTDQDRPL